MKKIIIILLAIFIISCNPDPDVIKETDSETEVILSFSEQVVTDFIKKLSDGSNRAVNDLSETEIAAILLSINTAIETNGLDSSEDLKALLSITSSAAQAALSSFGDSSADIINNLGVITEASVSMVGDRSVDIVTDQEILIDITDILTGNLDVILPEEDMAEALKVTTESLIVTLSEVSTVDASTITDTVASITQTATVGFSKNEITQLQTLKDGLENVTIATITSVTAMTTIVQSTADALAVIQNVSATVTESIVIIRENIDTGMTTQEVIELTSSVIGSATTEIANQNLDASEIATAQGDLIQATTEALLVSDSTVDTTEVETVIMANTSIDDTVIQLGVSSGADDFNSTLYVLGYGDDSVGDGIAFRENIEAFIAANPDIKVEWDMKYDEEFEIEQTSRFGNDNAIDISYTWNGDNRHKRILDAGEAVDQKQFISDIVDEYDAEGLIGQGPAGELYGIPLSRGAHTVFFANDALITSLGLDKATTYDELLAQKVAAEASGKFLIAYPGETRWCHNTFVYSLLVGRFGGYQHTVDLKNENAAFTDEPSVKAFEFIKRMNDDELFHSDFLTHNYDISLQEFNDGNSLYFIDGGWRAYDISLSDFSWNIFPSVPDEVAPGSSNGGYTGGYAIMKSASDNAFKQDNAIKLLKYLTGEDASIVRARVMGTPPIYNVQGTIVYAEGTEVSSVFVDTLSQVTMTIGDFISQTDTVKPVDTFQDGIIEIWNGTKTPAEVATETQIEYDKL